jgi:hypothetical protein
MSEFCGCAVEVPGESSVADWPVGQIYLAHLIPPRAAEQLVRKHLGLSPDAVARVVSLIRGETFQRLGISQGSVGGPL